MTAPLASVVLVTRNGARTLPAVLDAIARQRVDFAVETIAIDSGSTDGTVDLLRPRVDRVVSVPAASFNHGLTRNAGIVESRGRFVVLLVQDAVPASDRWLAALVDPFVSDDRLAGTFARQQPNADASAITRLYLSRWVAASGTPRTMAVPDRARFEALPPMDRFLACAFDNVCSCIRRTVWDAYPFRATAIAEDVEWAKTVLLAGHTLAYVPDAVVIHSHDRSARYEFDRTRVLHRRLYELFGLRTIPTWPSLARAIGSSILLHARCARADFHANRRVSDAGRTCALAVAWPLGQYIGGLAASRGWKARRPLAV